MTESHDIWHVTDGKYAWHDCIVLAWHGATVTVLPIPEHSFGPHYDQRPFVVQVEYLRFGKYQDPEAMDG